MSLAIEAANLLQGIERFGGVRLLVVGDIMLDRFIWGRVRRISPEAPVPVVEVESETQMLGGAANVVHNLVALGAEVSLCGLVGDDEAGRQVRDLLDGLEVGQDGLVLAEDRCTTVKTRVVAHGQQVVRVDREGRWPADSLHARAMWAYIEGRMEDGINAVIVSDYAKGVVTAELMDPLMAACQANGLMVAVDPKVSNMGLFKGATVVTPNNLEAAAAAGIEPEGEDYHLRAGQTLLQKLGARIILVTQGKKGMTLFEAQGHTHIPTTAKRVFDVTGAGDTVISTLATALAAGLEPLEAAYLANLAAGEVVGEVGTSALTAGRLARLVEDNAAPWAGKGV